MNTRSRVGLAVTAAVAMVLAGVWEVYPLHLAFGHWTSRQIEPSLLPITAGPGRTFCVDLASLGLRYLADNRCRWTEARVQLLENGVRLRRAVSGNWVPPGRFYQDDDCLLFAPSNGAPPDPATVYTLEYMELGPAGTVLHSVGRAHVLGWFAVLGLVACAVRSRLVHASRCVPELAVLLTGLFGFLCLTLVHEWDRVVLTNDTGSYIDNYLRPPLYPWFIACCQGELTFDPEDFPESGPVDHPAAALLRVTHAQKAAFYSSLGLMIAAFVIAFPHPSTVLFFFVVCQRRFLNESWCDQVLSEPLTASLIHLMVVAFLGLWCTRRFVYLPAMALCFTAAVLTRSAAACYLDLLAGSAVLALAWSCHAWRRWVGALLAVGVIGAAGLTCLLANNYRQNHFVSLAPLRNWERFAFALQCADDSDLERMPSPLARRFLADALAQKMAERQAEGREDALLEFDLNLNCWRIGHVLGNRLLLEEGRIRAPVPVLPRCGLVFDPRVAAAPLRTDGWSDCQELDGLFAEAADLILSAHRDRYWTLVRHSLGIALLYTRINEGPFPFSVILGGFLVCAAFGRNRLAAAGLVFIATHLFNLAVICLQEQPTDRYVWSTEWLCLIGFWFTALSAGQRRFAWFCERPAGELTRTGDGPR